MLSINQSPTTPPSHPLDLQLWQALKGFVVDEPGAELTFVKRLAEENRWSLTFAERVFDEYKRFLYLAIAADHPASPSDAVDQVWHLHLAYTRSYWNELCGKILKRELHHLPTQGGRAENEKHSDLYTRTLKSYELTFGQMPPSDIWPSAKQSSLPKEKFARIRTSDYLMIKKPGVIFQRTLGAWAMILVFSGTMAVCSSSSRIGFLPILLIGGIVAAVIYAIRNAVRNGRSDSSCSSDGCSANSCSSGSSSGFFGFFSSCSSDNGGSDSSDSSSGGDSSCSSSSCSSCSSCSSD